MITDCQIPAVIINREQGANKYLLLQTLKYFELSFTGINRIELIGPAGYNLIPFAASHSVILATQLASFKTIFETK